MLSKNIAEKYCRDTMLDNEALLLERLVPTNASYFSVVPGPSSATKF